MKLESKVFQFELMRAKTTAALVAGAGLLVCPQAVAQTDHMEWEPGEGIHEEEWYDPADWFDDDFDGLGRPDTDNEYDYEDGSVTAWDRDALVCANGWRNYAYSTLYVDGYHDGYGDAWNDGEYGYDVDVVGSDLSCRYKKGCIDGYYDSFCDQQRGYEADWTCYLYTVPIDRERASSQRERSDGADRQRGDRAQDAGTSKMSSDEARRDAKSKSRRFRGEVTDVRRLRWENAPSDIEDHIILRTTFDDGRTMMIDLGDQANSNIFGEGDKITVHGSKMTVKGKKLIDATRLSVNGEQLLECSECCEAREEHVFRLIRCRVCRHCVC